MTKKMLSNFKHDNREAKVGYDLDRNDYFVILIDDDVHVETKYCNGHSEFWAEEIAENWCQGILNVD